MKTVHVRYILTCKDTLENKDHTVDFIKVFDKKLFEKLPAKISFTLNVSLEYLMKSQEFKEIIIRILDPNEEAIANDLILKLEDLNNDKKNKIVVALNTVRLPNFPVKSGGLYKFLVIYKEEIISKHDVLFIEERIK